MKDVAVLIKNGKLGFIHNEDLKFMAKLGKTTINRLSTVEFNNSSQLWEVAHKGKILSTHKTRKEAITWEVAYFTKGIMAGKEGGENE